MGVYERYLRNYQGTLTDEQKELLEEKPTKKEKVVKEKVVKEKVPREKKEKRKNLPKGKSYYNYLPDTTLTEIQKYNNQYNELYKQKIAVVDLRYKTFYLENNFHLLKDIKFGFGHCGRNRLSYKFAVGEKPYEHLIIRYYENQFTENPFSNIDKELEIGKIIDELLKNNIINLDYGTE